MQAMFLVHCMDIQAAMSVFASQPGRPDFNIGSAQDGKPSCVWSLSLTPSNGAPPVSPNESNNSPYVQLIFQ